MVKKLLILGLLTTLGVFTIVFGFGFDTGRWGYQAGIAPSEVSDSCDSVRSEIRDTATLVWNDSVPRVDSAIHVVDSVSRSALDTAQAARDTATAALDTAQIARDTASIALIDALAALDTASAARDTATAALDTAQAARDTATMALDTASIALIDALAALDTASAGRDTATMALDTASLALIDALAALDTASAGRDTATMALDTASLALIDALAALDTASAGRDTASVALDTAQLAYGWDDWRGLELVEITGTDTITAAGGHLHIKEGSNIAISKDTDTLTIAATGLVTSTDFGKVTDDTTTWNTAVTTLGLVTDDTTTWHTAVTTLGLVTDDTTSWTKRAVDETVSGQWEHSDTLEITAERPIAWINAGNDTGRVWMDDNDTMYVLPTTGIVKVGNSMVVNAAGDIAASDGLDVVANASFGGAFHEDSTEADSAYATKGYADAHDVTNDVYVWAYLTTADQAIAYNTWTQVAFNAENMDLGSDFNTTTNEFTAPDSSLYVIDARANIQDNGGATDQGGSLIAIYRNDSLMVRGVKVVGYLGDPVSLDITDASCGPVVSATLYCPVDATIQIYAYQDFQDTGGGLIKKDAEETWVTIRKVN